MKTNTKIMGVTNKVMSTLLMSTIVINSVSPFAFATDNIENLDTVINNIENSITNDQEDLIAVDPAETTNTESVENTDIENMENTDAVANNTETTNTDESIESSQDTSVPETIDNAESIIETADVPQAGLLLRSANEADNVSLDNANIATANTETLEAPQAGPQTESTTGDSQDVIDRSVELSITSKDKNADGSPKTEFLTGEQIYLYGTIRTTGTELSMKNAKFKITVPKEKIYAKPVFNDVIDSTKTESEDANNWYVTYNFDDLRGGKAVSLPILYTMKASTHNDFTTDIKVELLNNENTVVKSTTQTITNKANYDSVTNIFTHINGKGYYTPNHDNGKIEIFNHEGYYDRTNIVGNGDEIYEGFYISINSANNAQYGTYIPEKVKIDVVLPEGAKLYNISNNSSWNYNPENRTATYSGSLNDWSITVDSISGNKKYKNIYIDYTGLLYGADIDGIVATITMDPDSDNPIILSPTTGAKVRFNYTKRVIGSDNALSPESTIENFFKKVEDKDYEIKFGVNKYDIIRDQNISEINIYSSNYVDKVIENNIEKNIENNNADKIHYKYLKLSNSNSYEFFRNNPHKIIGVKHDDSEVIIDNDGFTPAGNVFETINISDTNNEYKSIKIKFDNLANVNKNLGYYNGSGFITLGFRFNDGEAEKITENTNIRFNINTKIHYADNNTLTSGNYNNFNFLKLENPYVIRLNNYAIGNLTYSNNLIREVRSYYNSYKHQLDDTKLKNVKHIIVLPNGVEYVPGNGETNYSIIPNFKNTGKTAVVFDLGDKDINTNKDNSSYLPTRNIRITASTAEGINRIDTYMIWDNNSNDEVPSKYNFIDTLDLDNDGDKEEKFITNNINFTFSPPNEMYVTQYTSDVKVASSFQQSADIGGDIYYKITAFNNFTSAFDSVDMYSVLPAIGDHSILPDMQGNYQPRGSQFSPTMVSSIESIPENAAALEKFNVYYSTDSQGADFDSVKNATWKTSDQITDFSTVKMLKFELKPGLFFTQGLKSDILIYTKAPKDINLQDGAVAISSVAISNDGGANFIESNKTVNIISRYNVSGVVFEDKGSDGIILDRDIRLADYTVSLMKSDGTPALNLDGQPITTTTNTNGEYNFAVYNRGDYYVAVTKKDNSQTPTIKFDGNNGNSAIADANNNSIIKSIVNINPSQTNYIANAGFNIQATDGVININLHEEGNRSNKLTGGVFEIYDSTKTNLLETLATKINGIVTSLDLAYGDYVVINKTPVDGYKLSEIFEKTISLNGPSSSVTFTNVRKNQAESFVLNDPELTAVVNLTNLTTKEKNDVSTAIKTANPTAPIKTIVVANDGVATITFNDNSTLTIPANKTVKQATLAQINTITLPIPTGVVNLSALTEEEKNLVIQKINDRNPNKNIKNITIADNGVATIVFNDNSTRELTQKQTVYKKTQSELYTINEPEKIRVNNVCKLSENEKSSIIQKIKDANPNWDNLPIKSIVIKDCSDVIITFNDDSQIDFDDSQVVIQKTLAELFDIEKIKPIEVLDINNPQYFDYANFIFSAFAGFEDDLNKDSFSFEALDGRRAEVSIIPVSDNSVEFVFKNDDSKIIVPKNKLFKQKIFDKIPVSDINNISEDEQKQGLEFLKSNFNFTYIDGDYTEIFDHFDNVTFKKDENGKGYLSVNSTDDNGLDYFLPTFYNDDRSVIPQLIKNTVIFKEYNNNGTASTTTSSTTTSGYGGHTSNSVTQPISPTSTPELTKNIENPNILNSTSNIIFDISDKSIKEDEKNIFDLNSAPIEEKNIIENKSDLFSQESNYNDSVSKNNSQKFKLPDYLPATGFESAFMIFVFSSIISYAVLSSRRRYND